jgi:tetratricopeptide (TPR) repeat protein
MKPNLSDWDDDFPPDGNEECANLITALERKTGFGLFFVQCTARESERVITRVTLDLTHKNVQVLRLVDPIDNLYDLVAGLYRQSHFDVLMIKGLEYSLYKYEKRHFGEITEGQFSNLTNVPPVLNHLNQQRERFRDDFPVNFVFLLRPFSINYLIHRAPDFFDWRSGFFTLPVTPEILEEESARLISSWDYESYLKLNPEERIVRFLEIQELLKAADQTDANRANLLWELGTILSSTQEYEAATNAFEAALRINPQNPQTWYRLGYALGKRELHLQALDCFQAAVRLQPNNHQAWFNQGIAMYKLGRFHEALENLDRAIAIKDDYFLAWFKRGVTLNDLERYTEAIAAFDQALKINPHAPEVWYARARSYAIQGKTEQAWENLQEVLRLNPQDYAEKIQNNPEFKERGVV